MRRLLCAATSLLLPALVFLGSAMSRLGDGSIHAAASGRSAHEHATVRFGGSFEGSPRSTEQLAPPRAAPSAAPPVRAGAPAASATNANFLKPGGGSKLLFNEAARQQLAPYAGAAGTTVHFTFGSSVMVDFVQNWLHFARRAALKPLLVGAADAALLSFCNNKSVPAAAISPDLDVWTYERKPAKEGVYQIKTQWAYFRHHDSDFLEMGLVKVAFLWELLAAGLNVLISDLDVVWLNGHWARWMAYGGAEPPLPEASLLAAADILVSTDELNAEADLAGRRPSHGSDLNTGVVFLRCTQGSKAMVQAWRQAMLGRKGDKHLNENVNDQSLFQGVVRGAELRGGELDELLRRSGAVDRLGLAEATSTRRVYRALGGPPCLPQERCARSSFTFGTLPMRPFSGGHTWFNQNVQDMAGHEQPRNEPITVHFTFQFGDTGTYPHGKRQRAREAALWAVDPPEYFTEGVFVALDGPTYSEAEQAAVYARFPSWSPQRHMHMDAPQRQAVRDLLGLATAVGGIPVLPSLWCHCDRYWGFLKNCRFPMVPNMNLPFNCPQDALYDPTRWAAKGVRWREHTFLDNPNVPALLRTQTVTVTVAAPGEVPAAAAPDQISLAYGTPLSEVMAAVKQARPGVRVIRIANHHLRRLCRWLGSSQANADFNKLARYILTESSRYCPQEDMGGYGGGSFDWQNPFVAYNCTWGFHYPSPFPDDKAACSATGEQRERSSSAGGLLSSLLPPVNAAGEPLAGADGVNVAERPNSTTCPRIMLCDYNILPDGSMTKPIRWCNIEGYNGMKQDHLPATRAMLAKMPDGRCPYPPGDVPGMPGFDLRGHYIGA